MWKNFKIFWVTMIIFAFIYLYHISHLLSQENNILNKISLIILSLVIGITYVFIFERVFPEKKGLKCKLLKRIRSRFKAYIGIHLCNIDDFHWYIDNKKSCFVAFNDFEESKYIMINSCLSVRELNRLNKKKFKWINSKNLKYENKKIN